ncbi:MAG: RNase adapter RapZ [Gammaproteobacteria bacterium]|nr:MAG: RNase adapter RapZ [Gammaproteobacteria bacterium]
MSMIIVSGLSGAGKTVALHALEDLGYYCIDNLPVSLLPALFEEQKRITQPVAVGIDIRSQYEGAKDLIQMIKQLKEKAPRTQILYLSASNEALIKRFSESRRKHPLSDTGLSLPEAIAKEQHLLSPLMVDADFQIDSSATNIYELKSRIREWLNVKDAKTFLTIESFGFKHGVPVDADLMFDVRFLPNPYWEAELRAFTGRDAEIQDYLGQFDECERFIADTSVYLSRWLPTYFNSYRSYLTVGIGCTGGKHRSVYITEKLAKRLEEQFGLIHVRHRDLPAVI